MPTVPPIADAIASVSNESTGLTGSSRPMHGGAIGFLPLLPPGYYAARIARDRFKNYERLGLTLTAGATVLVDVTLEAGPVTESITWSRWRCGHASRVR